MTYDADCIEQIIDYVWNNKAIMHEAASICTYRDECRPTDYEAACTAAMIIFNAFGKRWNKHSDVEMLFVIDSELLECIEMYEAQYI